MFRDFPCDRQKGNRARRRSVLCFCAPCRHSETHSCAPCGRCTTLTFVPCGRSVARSCPPCMCSETRPCAPRGHYVTCSSAPRRRSETRLCAICRCCAIIFWMPHTRFVIQLACAVLAHGDSYVCATPVLCPSFACATQAL